MQDEALVCQSDAAGVMVVAEVEVGVSTAFPWVAELVAARLGWVWRRIAVLEVAERLQKEKQLKLVSLLVSRVGDLWVS